MKKILFIAAALLALVACKKEETPKQEDETMSSIKQETIQRAIDTLIAMPVTTDEAMITRGVNSAASLWTEADGTQDEFVAFCRQYYVADSAERFALFNRLDRQIESLRGHGDMVYVDFMFPLHVRGQQITIVDDMFAAYDPLAHFTDDMFESKIAFVTLLNFPVYTLEEKNAMGGKWSREQWAYARIADWFIDRVPASLTMAFAKANSEAGTYVETYDIKMGKVRNEKGEQLFPDGMSLISHWNLRDELKAEYADTSAVAREKQEIIYKIMERIIDQSIPQCVINSEEYMWYPYSNKVTDLKGNEIKAEREMDMRYQHLLNQFYACRALDKYNPTYPTAIKRAFNRDMEVSDEEIEAMFTAYLSSEQAGQVVALVKQRLGRDLRPFDIWYDGFKARSSINVEELNVKCRTKYPTPNSFRDDMANILVKLGFPKDKADFIQSMVEVDASRSAGHAWTSQAKFEKSRLRTRIADNGFDYLGYNIACHEFGHNVEQTISIQDVDYYSMARVPSTAFTEALAFVFQKRDLQLLGINSTDEKMAALNTIDIFWNGYEMMGVSLLDLYTWRWMYENPDCTPEQLREQVIKTAKELWNKYYAPHFGVKDSPVLAIYSHMVSYPLYLSNYAYGNIVEAQLEEWFEGKNVGEEILRIYRGGKLTPDHWMQNARGENVSPDALLKKTAEAVAVISQTK